MSNYDELFEWAAKGTHRQIIRQNSHIATTLLNNKEFDDQWYIKHLKQKSSSQSILCPSLIREYSVISHSWAMLRSLSISSSLLFKASSTFSPSYSTIAVTKEANLRSITLNRPDKLNAFNNEMYNEVKTLVWIVHHFFYVHVILVDVEI